MVKERPHYFYGWRHAVTVLKRQLEREKKKSSKVAHYARVASALKAGRKAMKAHHARQMAEALAEKDAHIARLEEVIRHSRIVRVSN